MTSISQLVRVMYRFVVLVVLMISLFAPRVSDADDRCSESISDLRSETHSMSGEVLASEYDQPFYRRLVGYAGGLGRGFVSRYNKLSEGDVWVDFGSGLGLAVLEGTIRKGIEGYALNAQDFWGEFFRSGGDKRWDPSMGVPEEWGYFSRASRLPIEATFEILNTVRPDRLWDQPSQLHPLIYKAEVLNATFQVREQLLALKESKKYNYRVGMAQEFLENTSKKIDLATDYFGAFFYSKNRVQLLEKIYQRLAEDGEGYFVFGQKSRAIGMEIKDRVQIGGKNIGLIEYLVNSYPTVFSVYERKDTNHKFQVNEIGVVESIGYLYKDSSPLVLIMKKDPLLSKINFGLSVKDMSWNQAKTSKGFVVPEHIYSK